MIDRRIATRMRVSRSPSRTLRSPTLVGRYIERRERGEAPCAHDLLAVAAEFGDAAVDALRTVLAFYEAMRASEPGAR